MRPILPLLVLTCLPTGALSAQDVSREAIVVGVPAYSAGQGLNLLPYAENDALLLADVLKSRRYHVTRLTPLAAQIEGDDSLRPTAASIRDRLDTVLDNPDLGSDDILLIAWASRAVTLDDVEHVTIGGQVVEERIPRLFFCTADTILRTGESDDEQLTLTSQVEERHHLISLEELYERADRCQAGIKLLLVDACRNNLSRNGCIALPDVPPPPDGVAALFSCSPGQRSCEDRDLAHGVFFYHVTEALRYEIGTFVHGQALEDVTTLTDLHAHVSAAVPAHLVEHDDFFIGAIQQPHLTGTNRETDTLVRIPPALLISPFSEDQVHEVQQVWAEFLGTQVIVENSIGIPLALIPPGEFMMGNPVANRADSGRQRVRLIQPYLTGIHEVTLGQFRTFVEDAEYVVEFEGGHRGGSGWNAAAGQMEFNDPLYDWQHTGWSPYEDNHPVVNVSWYDAIAFCNWLSRKENLREYYIVRNTTILPAGGNGYRLLTEAEWENACRAGTTTQWYHGNNSDGLIATGNVQDASDPKSDIDWNDGYRFTAPVGQFAPNAFGLFDMHGNAGEWCWDCYNTWIYSRRSGTTVDPVEHVPEVRFSFPFFVTQMYRDTRVRRGPSWFHQPGYSRASSRDYDSPGDRGCYWGFRVARTP